MQHTPHTATPSLGADLRALRKARGLTLQDMADRLDRSVGWVSQVERDLSDPSIDDLRQIAKLLNISISTLFAHSEAPANEAGTIVRRNTRRPLGSREAGLVEELISPDLTDDFEVVHCVFQPGATCAGDHSRPTQEVGYVVSGQLDLIIAGRAFTVTPGDSFRVRGDVMHWSNPYPEPATVIWVIAPPVY